MHDLEHARMHAASELLSLMDHHLEDRPYPDHIGQIYPVLDAIAEYTIALALDRIDKAGADTAPGRLAAALLTKHATNTPTPP